MAIFQSSGEGMRRTRHLSTQRARARGSRRRPAWKSVLVVAASVAITGMTAAPASAATGDTLLGHRCSLYPAATTIENTVAAVADVSQYAGIWCEIDARRLADGTLISFHDPTWKRVADPDSLLAAGVTADSPVAQATWEQVSLIRTKGGAPIARIEDMITAAAQYDVGLIAELKGARASAATAKRLVDLASSLGADVWWYQNPERSCTLRKSEPFKTAGAKIGVKMTLSCPFTPVELRERGATFITERPSLLTKESVTALTAEGVTSVARNGTAKNIKGLLENGVWRVMTNSPKDAMNW